MNRLLNVMVFIIILPGCTCNAGEYDMEPLMGIQLTGQNNLRIMVTSSGCTSADSFLVGNTENRLTIWRIKDDHCRRLPFAVWIDLEVDAAAFHLENPFRQMIKQDGHPKS